MRLHVIHQHSPFCPILARFMGYYSPFWGPMRFLGFRTPTFDYVQVINTRSLADSGPFRGPFWGPGAIFKIAKPQGVLTYRSSTLAVFADSSPFHGITHRFAVPVRFPWL